MRHIGVIDSRQIIFETEDVFSEEDRALFGDPRAKNMYHALVQEGIEAVDQRFPPIGYAALNYDELQAEEARVRARIQTEFYGDDHGY